MEAFQKKSFETARNFYYTYYVAAGDESLPALVLLHGFPDHAAMWKEVATALRATNRPIVIPDLLGYDGTDKPTDPQAYKWEGVTQDLVDILDFEGLQEVIAVGHDWGAVCASRLYNYHPSRILGLVLLSVPYQPPSQQDFSMEAINKMAEHFFGYPAFSYWKFFSSPDAPKIFKDNSQRLFNILHGEEETLNHYFRYPDLMERYLLEGGEDINLRPYARDPRYREDFIARMARDGFEGPLCWYRATTGNYHTAGDKQLPVGAEQVHVPLLFIGGKDDAPCKPEVIDGIKQSGLVPDLEQAPLVDAAHWTMHEQPGEVVGYIRQWLEKYF